MIYVVTLVLSVLALLNLCASWKVVHDDFSTVTQKLMQLGLIWLLPIIGAVLTMSLVSGTRHPTVDMPSQSGMKFVNYWHSTEGTDYGFNVSSDSSCD